MSGALFVFGLGYAATHLARKARAQGWRVSGTVRSHDKAARLRGEDISAHVFVSNDLSPQLLKELTQASHVLQSVGLLDGKDPILPVFTPYLKDKRWVGYLSTTVVYGDHGGARVDETTPPQPMSARGQSRLAAERAWAALPVPVHIFRLAGIYGPGRNPLEKILSGKARTIVKPGHVFSRIHVEDIARLVLASMAAPAAAIARPEIYNGADDQSASPQNVNAFAAQLLGVPPPPLIPIDEADLSAMARSFYSDHKRVDNGKMRALTGPLAFPTYREGLRALVT